MNVLGPMTEKLKKALFDLLRDHERNGTLDDQTPRLLRTQLAESLGESVEESKEEIKLWITEFLENENKRPPTGRENKPHKNRSTKSVKRKQARDEESESSSDSSSSEDESSESDSSKSAVRLRSIAKMLGVPPSFWSNLDKNNADSVAQKLKLFCEARSVPRAGSIPTMKEAKKYKAKREAENELEGITEANIVESKKRRCREFLPAFSWV